MRRGYSKFGLRREARHQRRIKDMLERERKRREKGEAEKAAEASEPSKAPEAAARTTAPKTTPKPAPKLLEESLEDKLKQYLGIFKENQYEFAMHALAIIYYETSSGNSPGFFKVLNRFNRRQGNQEGSQKINKRDADTILSFLMEIGYIESIQVTKDNEKRGVYRLGENILGSLGFVFERYKDLYGKKEV